MRRMRIVTVVGTRPEIIRLSSTIKLLDSQTNHTLIHTGQNYDYELNEIFFDDLNLKQPKFFLNAVSTSPSATIGKIIQETEKLLLKIKPDAFLVLGDTNSCLSVIPAKRLKIPIFHMEAGNRCFDLRVPEEINRKIVDHTADINITYSSISRDYLLREGFPPDQVIKLGSPMKEVILDNSTKINNSNILSKMKLSSGQYFLVSCHREENIDNDKQFKDFILMLNSVAKLFNKRIIVSTHPRTRNRLKKVKFRTHKLIDFVKPLSFSDYISLQMHAKVVLSDSGTISEEASILGLDAINIRDCHERPEASEEASVIMTGMNKDRVMQSIKLLSNKKSNSNKTNIVFDYNVENFSTKVLRTIHSHTDFVNKKVWRKY